MVSEPIGSPAVTLGPPEFLSSFFSLSLITGELSDNKGVIDLKEVTAVHGPTECNWPKEENPPKEAGPLVRLELVTPARTYRMFAADGPSAIEWSQQLEKVSVRRSGCQLLSLPQLLSY